MQTFAATGVRTLQIMILQQKNHDLAGLLPMLAVPFGGPQRFRLIL